MTAHGTAPLWLATDDAPAHPPLAHDLDVDVAVIGGGIAGVTTALLCRREGMRVALLERDAVCAGATGYTTAKVSALQQTKLSQVRGVHGADGAAAYAAASLAAIERIDALVREHAIDCGWERLPAYTYAGDAGQVEAVEREAQAARDAGLGAELTSDTPLPFAVPAAVRLDGQAQFHPVRYVRALAAALDDGDGDGARVFERTAVTGVHDGSPCRVETAQGATVTAGAVVVCTNYPLLDRGLFFARIETTRSYALGVRVRGDEVPRGMLISAGSPTRSIRPYEHDGETWLIVGGEGHPTGSGRAEPERWELLERFAREHFDVAEVPYRWSTQDGMPVDRLPFAGSYLPRSTRLFVNCGGQKWGMTNATVGATVVADRLAGRANPHAATLDPTRLAPRAVPSLARAQARVGAHFVGDRVAPAQASSSDEVPRGEARVVRDGVGKVGVFRDDDGELHGVTLRCTHLGCLVHWNDAEQTWDCPCHGSRFGVDGAVIAGPATSALERREPPA